MSEWPKEHAWKACVLEKVPRVRIPLSPPDVLSLAFEFDRAHFKFSRVVKKRDTDCHLGRASHGESL